MKELKKKLTEKLIKKVFNHSELIDEIITDFKESEEFKQLILSGVVNKLKNKKITDLLNWVKSDLAQETKVKLGKTATPYRTEKLKFLNKLLEIENL
jgi:enolase